MSALLEAVGVRAGYDGATVVDGVDLRVLPGELWVILGPNGAGKSTFLRALLGLHTAEGGTISVLGRPLAQWSRDALARSVAWVPQMFEAAFGFTGLELVVMGRSPHLGLWGLPAVADVDRAREAMAELEIAHLADRPATALSGGEQRLLLLARAFVQAPALLLLDEPTAFLDLRHQVQMLQRLKARTRTGSMGAVAVLHDVNLAAAFADRVLLLRDGRALASGPVASTLASPILESLYGVPMAEVRAPDGQSLFAPRLG